MQLTVTDPLTPFLVIAAVYLIVYLAAKAIGIERLSKRGFEAGTPLLIVIKTKRLNDFLTRAGRRIPRALFNFGILCGFLGMIFGFWLFGTNLWNFLFKPESAGGVVPIIPGVTITGLPLVYMIIGLAVTLLTHEFAHGLAASRDNVPIKSSGLLFFYVLFGGFVEPDDEVFEKQASPKDRMRILAAGSFSNMVWAFIFLALIMNFSGLMSIGFNPPSGAYIYQIADESPASGVLEDQDVIFRLNLTQINYWSDVSVFMANATAGSHLDIGILRNDVPMNITIVLAPSPANASRGYIGVFGADYWKPKPGWEWIPGGPLYAFHAQQILVWCFTILFSIAVFNLLPIPFLDGDKLLSNGLLLVFKRRTTTEQAPEIPANYPEASEQRPQLPRPVGAVMLPIRLIALSIVLLNIILSLVSGKGIF